MQSQSWQPTDTPVTVPKADWVRVPRKFWKQRPLHANFSFHRVTYGNLVTTCWLCGMLAKAQVKCDYTIWEKMKDRVVEDLQEKRRVLREAILAVIGWGMPYTWADSQSIPGHKQEFDNYNKQDRKVISYKYKNWYHHVYFVWIIFGSQTENTIQPGQHQCHR